VTGRCPLPHKDTRKGVASRRRRLNAKALHSAVDASPLPARLADSGGRTLVANRSWLQMTGLDEREAEGDGWLDSVDPEDRQRYRDAFEAAVRAESPARIVYRLRRGASEGRQVRDTLHFERDTFGFLHCVIASIPLEFEQGASVQAREREACATSDRFLSLVSHEMRSPLHSIQTWVHVLENHDFHGEPVVGRALAGIRTGVAQQLRLIEELLDAARVMSGQLRLMKAALPLRPALEAALHDAREAARGKGVRLTVRMSLDADEIDGDADRIRQAFANLLDNAVKFTPGGGAVTVGASAEGGRATVAVSDTGPGLEGETLASLFDPFRHATRNVERRMQEGLGLGLAVARGIIELHGGKLSAESAGLECGATFRVTLPLRLAAVPAVHAAIAGEAAGSTLPSLSGVRVLLVDDQKEAREAVATLLGQAGASVRTAESGREAMAVLQSARQDDFPDVLICDIAMPEEDGYTTLKRIRAWQRSQPGEPALPAVALTAFAEREDRVRSVAAGFQMHLSKPVAPLELALAVESIARGRRAG
jgi:PAS domain S-box-containing protein